MRAETIHSDLSALQRNVKDKGRQIISSFMNIQQMTKTLNTKVKQREEGCNRGQAEDLEGLLKDNERCHVVYNATILFYFQKHYH